MTRDPKSALRGGAIGAAAAVVAFSGMYVALAASQGGIEESQAPATPAATVQPGLETAQQPTRSASATKAKAKPVTQRRAAPTKQPGLTEAVREVTKIDKPDERRKRASDAASLEASPPSPAPVQLPSQAAPAPAPVRQAPGPVTVYRAPAPVQQAPVPVRQGPAPVQQAPAPVTAPAPEAVRLVPQLPVVPQEPIPLNPIRIG